MFDLDLRPTDRDRTVIVDETADAGAPVTLTDAQLDKVTAGTGVSQASRYRDRLIRSHETSA